MDARKAMIGRSEAIKLAKAADKVIISKGKGRLIFNMAKAPPSDEDLAAAILGPTGNLRAPTLRIGRTLLVGFSEDAYRNGGIG